MSMVFGKGYSSAYDQLYREKDYRTECSCIEKIIREHGIPARSILDLGCGTGSHALILSEQGYHVTGVDRSSEMLDIAREKARKKGLDCNFIQSDIRTFRTKDKFDTVIMMFAVLGYLSEDEDIRKALETVRIHLKPGGLFICDVWYGPAVLHQKPGERELIVEDGDTKIFRSSSGDLDSMHHTVTVHFRLRRITSNKPAEDFFEEHRMRFFFTDELRAFMDSVGLKLSLVRTFPDIDSEPNENSWNVWVVAERPLLETNLSVKNDSKKNSHNSS